MSDQNSRSSRPKIWAEGRQHPPFDLRAFARASYVFGRESMAALLTRCAGSATVAGTKVASGRWRIPEKNLGRTGRLLPDHARVAQAVLGGAEVLSSSARVLVPDVVADTPTPIKTVGQVATPVRLPRAEANSASLPQTVADDPDLASIRALILSGPTTDHVPPGDTTATTSQPPVTQIAEPTPSRLRAALTGPLSVVLGWGLLAVSLPYGALRALYAHLSGQDLRQLDH